MPETLTGLKNKLEERGVYVKYIKNGVLYCRHEENYSKLKVMIQSGEKPYHVMKEGLSGNEWGEYFKSIDELADFINSNQ